MGRIEQVLDCVNPIINAAINAANASPSNVVYTGWPTAPDLADTLNQTQTQVSLFPHAGGRRVPPRKFAHVNRTVYPSTITATVAGNVVTLSGTPTAGQNVFVYLDQGIASHNIATGETLAQTIAALQTAINGLSGASASVSGDSLTITGSNTLTAAALGTGQLSRELLRWEQRVQVSVWAPTAELRNAITMAFLPAIGTDDAPFIDLGDQSTALFRLSAPPVYRDDGQLTNNAFESHTMYTAEYSILGTYGAAQVGEINETFNLPGSVVLNLQNTGVIQ